MKEFRANGKLMFTAEYTVLKGALSLALPTRFGQTLKVEEGTSDQILEWQSLDVNGNTWFTAFFERDFSISETSDKATAERVKKMLVFASKANPTFLPTGKSAITKLEFDRNWGLGSSSTLVSLIAQWAGIDSMQLFFNTQTGSGYDVICANAEKPVLYELSGVHQYNSKAVAFNPPFKDELHFVYLGKKQKSAKEVARVSSHSLTQSDIQRISAITKSVIESAALDEFERLMVEHEEVTGHFIGVQPIKQSTFSDYSGTVKSLGAWGGDFIMVSRLQEQPDYFSSRGYHTVLPWQEMFGT